MKGTALFSLNDTSRAVEFAKHLIRARWKIIASAETVKILKKKEKQKNGGCIKI